MTFCFELHYYFSLTTLKCISSKIEFLSLIRCYFKLRLKIIENKSLYNQNSVFYVKVSHIILSDVIHHSIRLSEETVFNSFLLVVCFKVASHELVKCPFIKLNTFFHVYSISREVEKAWGSSNIQAVLESGGYEFES